MERGTERDKKGQRDRVGEKPDSSNDALIFRLNL